MKRTRLSIFPWFIWFIADSALRTLCNRELFARPTIHSAISGVKTVFKKEILPCFSTPYPRTRLRQVHRGWSPTPFNFFSTTVCKHLYPTSSKVPGVQVLRSNTTNPYFAMQGSSPCNDMHANIGRFHKTCLGMSVQI